MKLFVGTRATLTRVLRVSAISATCALVGLGSIASHAETWLIEHARVATQTQQGVIEDGSVLVVDGRVTAVGSELRLPAGGQRLDAGGQWLTPGFIESYSQIGLVEIGAESTTVDSAVADFPLGPAFDVRYALNADSVLLAEAVRAGVTSAIVAPVGANDPLAGWGALVHLGGEELLLRPQLAMFGSLTNPAADLVGGSRGGLLVRLRHALSAARRFNPTRHLSEPKGYTVADMMALKEWLSGSQPLVLSVHQASQILQAIDLAKTYRKSLIVIGGREAWKVAPQLAAADAAVIVDPMANIPIGFDSLGARLDNAALLHEAGVSFAFTSENTHNPGWIRQGAGIAVANGLPFDAALAAISSNPAKIWGIDDLGQIAVGKHADLVLWSGDPLEVTTHATQVMVDGQWQSLETRQTRLRDRYRDLSNTVTPFGYR